MIVTHKLNMDLVRRDKSPCIDVMQDDKYSRDLEIRLQANGIDRNVPEDCGVLVRYRKADGRHGAYDTMPDGTKAWNIRDGLLTVRLAPQVCTVAGKVELTVTLLRGQTELSMFDIRLNVHKRLEGVKGSENYIHIGGFVPQPASAAVGQYLKVAATDETGRVTAVESADGLSGGEEGTLDHSQLRNRDAARQHPIQAITGLEEALAEKVTETELDQAVNEALEQAAAEGNFGGGGKSAYAYAQEGGYTGTEAEFAAKLAAELPKAFYVTLSQVGGEFVADKTTAEMEAAYQAGCPLYCIFPYQGLPLCMPFAGRVLDGMAWMFANTAAGMSLMAQITDYQVILQSSEYLTQENLPQIPTSLPNPYKLTFTGAISSSYNGALPITVTIPKGLPEVTTAQNGAILQVVDGAWATVAMTNAEEVSF